MAHKKSFFGRPPLWKANFSKTLQVFYSRCGYTFSQPVCAFGGSSKLKMDMFSKCAPTVSTSSLPISNNDAKSSRDVELQQTNITRSESQRGSAPPPPPPGPPPPSASNRVSSNDITLPGVSLLSTCAKALSSPCLVDVAAKLAPKLLTIKQDGYPQIDPALGKGKNTEDAGGKMCMSKKLC